ncbi:kinase domain protein, putative (macronuclear) [Tetrahymena thermophila SB210]|uniref:Kinase domain protein, putative n=1 Tax=Tetrahymena thermophila (strain SB210) TaxID=312017 RepID=W7X4K7_TETTS|nr:kinase domain protein, putative [Tetrahymena thermophila SB210]EWS71313.1 kinase domain protein, putative [Tetrahymena thermophila SB210]|eukprot:XP_012656131.1 kinase domain protein, putative [Tetrahymena thermophila SB210]
MECINKEYLSREQLLQYGEFQHQMKYSKIYKLKDIQSNHNFIKTIVIDSLYQFEIPKLVNDLSLCKNLIILEIDLSKGYIQHKGFEQICQSLSKCIKLSVLNLNLSQIQLSEMSMLCLGNSLKKCTTILDLSLNLMQNSDHKQGFSMIAEGIIEMKGLFKLKIAYYDISPLLDKIHNLQNIQILDLDMHKLNVSNLTAKIRNLKILYFISIHLQQMMYIYEQGIINTLNRNLRKCKRLVKYRLS